MSAALYWNKVGSEPYLLLLHRQAVGGLRVQLFLLLGNADSLIVYKCGYKTPSVQMRG